MVRLRIVRTERIPLTATLSFAAVLATGVQELFFKIRKIPRKWQGRLRVEHFTGSWGLSDDPVDEIVLLRMTIGSLLNSLGDTVPAGVFLTLWLDEISFRNLTGVGVIKATHPISYLDGSPSWLSTANDAPALDELQIIAFSTADSSVRIGAVIELVLEINHWASSDRESPLSRFSKQVMYAY